MDANKKFETVDEYIGAAPKEARERLTAMRLTIKKAAPKAKELISYNIPAFRLEGVLVYYAAFKNHIGFYPRTTGISKFKKELSKFKSAKGSVQFPTEQPLPLGLIGKIVKFRVQENLQLAQLKARKKKKK